MSARSAWSRVELARHPRRPTARHYIDSLFTDFIELHGDQLYAEDAAIIGGIGRFDGLPVTVIAEEKGSTTNEKARRNFGSPHPEGYRKSLRLMKQAEKFSRPILLLVDTQGAFCGIGAEERGQGRAIAENLLSMMVLEVPTITIVIGEGGSGGALALAVSDRVALLENAVYSILSPEGFASILWKDASRAHEAASVMKLTAADLRELGAVDDVLPEPPGGAQENPAQAAQTVGEYIRRSLGELRGVETQALLEARYAKFRRMGVDSLVE